MQIKLQYISQGKTSSEQLENIRQALDAGCKWIQLRFKYASEEDLIKTAEKAKDLCAKHEAVFIVNDRLELAKTVDADGVHLGLSDESPVIARALLGKEKIIGGTANTLDDVLQRVEEGCDYVGLGPFRFTTTKEKLSPVLGTEGYENIIGELKKRNVKIPVYAIGGIVPEDVTDLLYVGVHGIAVSGIITNHKDKKAVVEQLNHYLHAST
jgi:thiamine-phosphate pyrophosphorylase